MGCQQFLPLSIFQLKGKHCQKLHCCNGVVDTFGFFSRALLPRTSRNLVSRYLDSISLHSRYCTSYIQGKGQYLCSCSMNKKYKNESMIKSLVDKNGATFLMTSHVRSALWTLPLCCLTVIQGPIENLRD